MSAPALSVTAICRKSLSTIGVVFALVLICGASLGTAAPAQRTSGDQQWASLFAPAGQLDCRAVAAATAADGSLYVAASSAAVTGGPRDIVLLKYAADGTLTWQQVVGGPGDDRPVAVAVDGNDNAVLAGTMRGATTGDDAYVVKYSPAGVRRWAAFYRGPGRGADAAADVAADLHNGAVYVAATTSGPGGRRATVLKFTAAGHREWVRRYVALPRPSAAGALAVDPSGNAYICGSYSSHGDLAGLVVKYTRSGRLAWRASMTGARQRDSAFYDVALGPKGRLYACGSRGVALGAGAVLVAYRAQSGRAAWVTTLRPTALGENLYDSVDCDAAGNAVVVGEVTGGSATGRQAVTVKYRSSGATQWMRFYNATTTADADTLSDLALDGTGRVFAVGTSHAAAGDQMVTLSYTSSGVLRWATLYGGPAAGLAIALGRSSSVYAVGFAAAGTAATESAAVSYQP
jgi:hypothetical protein